MRNFLVDAMVAICSFFMCLGLLVLILLACILFGGCAVMYAPSLKTINAPDCVVEPEAAVEEPPGPLDYDEDEGALSEPEVHCMKMPDGQTRCFRIQEIEPPAKKS